jgi:SAM-dependent methyltransferase
VNELRANQRNPGGMEGTSTTRLDGPTAQDLYTSGSYLERVPTWHVEESASKAREIVRLLGDHHLAPHSICEVGCGAGEVLRQLQLALPPSTELTGYDIAPVALELAAPRANDHLHFVLGDFVREATSYSDMILVLDVIEHVEDYFTFLRALKRKGDYKVFFFPLDLSAQTVIRPYGLLRLRDAYGHLHFFTRELALRTLADTGYTVVDAVYTADALELPTRLVGRHLLKLPRKLLFALHQDFAVHLLGGYRLLVLAQ